MRKHRINGQDIEAVVIAEDGTELQESLDSAELDLLAKIDAALKADAGFQAACPGARLVRADSNRGLSAHYEGRFYLRYQHDGGVGEFWGNLADSPKIDLEQGLVGVAG